jgi:hypothetical protein
MFISEVNEMRTFVVRAILTSLGDEINDACTWSQRRPFVREKKGTVVKSFCWDVCTIRVDMTESYIFNY